MSWFAWHVVSPGRRAKMLLAGIALLGVAIWLTFFDTHSIANRIRWSQEIAEIRAQNEAIRAQTAVLEEKLKGAKSDEVIEQIAREEYGMRRPGERIYRVTTE